MMRASLQMTPLLLGLVLGGCVQQQAIIPVPDSNPPQYNRATSNPIAIERVVSQVTRGQTIGTVMGGLLCIPHVQLIANGAHGGIRLCGRI